MTSLIKTRKAVCCPVFGTPKLMSEIILPTYEDVMKHYLFVKHELKPTASKKEPTVSQISEKVSRVIEGLWTKSSIPVISHKRTLQMIRSYHDKYQKLMKNIKRNNTIKITSFRNAAKGKLFDICACKCAFETNCNCDKTRRVPSAERAFLQDQRTLRLMCISSIDQLSSKKLALKLQRRTREQHRTRKLSSSVIGASSNNDIEPQLEIYQDDNNSVISDDASVDNDNSQTGSDTPAAQSEIDCNLNIVENKSQDSVSCRRLPALARACDRYGISDRSAAAIASAVLEDFGIVTASDLSNVIDPSKIRRERKRKRSELKPSHDSTIVRGIYFDGRKDKTLKNIKDGSKFYRQTTMEEHISLIQEPDSLYLGHLSPAGSSAKEIKDSIANFIATKNINIEKLVSIGCDGTLVNTGRKGGVIRLLEKEYNKPLQWLVCLLHTNELPLRHLLQHLDGPTSGPRAFSGPIGKALENCRALPVVPFDKIDADLPVVVLNDLSNDQKYLWQMCEAISKGECSLALSKRNPGALNHSRWITTANRLLRLYVASHEPSTNLKHLVIYIMRVYSPVWFSIKMHPSCKDSAKHLFRAIQLSRYLSKELRDVIDPVLQRNGYFGHPENLLLTMIADERQYIRELGLRRILKARAEKQTVLREFVVPKLNLDANEYFELINWQDTKITEPPLTADVPEADIRSFVKSGGQSTIEFERFPCHTQAVERCVKIVTEASLAVCGEVSRDGFIRSRLEGRLLMPVFNTKSDYRVTL